MVVSKSSPPKWVSPAVARTCKIKLLFRIKLTKRTRPQRSHYRFSADWHRRCLHPDRRLAPFSEKKRNCYDVMRELSRGPAMWSLPHRKSKARTIFWEKTLDCNVSAVTTTCRHQYPSAIIHWYKLSHHCHVETAIRDWAPNETRQVKSATPLRLFL